MAIKIKDEIRLKTLNTDFFGFKEDGKFNAPNKLKKGVYFTIDGVIAGGIILIVLVLASSFYAKEQPSTHLNFLSQDLIRVLSALTVDETDNIYINERISSGDITNLKNTILEQIGEFWADNEIEFANKTVQNLTEPFISNITGFGMWINNESIYQRSTPITSSLVSNKKIISGIAKGKTSGETRQDPPALWGPAIIEVRVWE